jgi:hypothetical protein
MTEDNLYVRRDQPDHIVHVSAMQGGVVTYAPEGGGFQQEVSEAKFSKAYRAATPDDLARLRNFSKGAVIGDWAEDPAPIPAWLNAELWNGFPQPAFEKSDLLEAIATGQLPDTHYHEPGDAFIFLENCGEAIPAFDPAELFPRLMDSVKTDSDEIELGGQTIEVYVFRGRDLALADGTSVHVYDVGAGYWTWGLHEEPEPSLSPTP